MSITELEIFIFEQKYPIELLPVRRIRSKLSKGTPGPDIHVEFASKLTLMGQYIVEILRKQKDRTVKHTNLIYR